MCHVLIGIIVLLILCWVLSYRPDCSRMVQRVPNVISGMRALAKKAASPATSVVDYHLKVSPAIVKKSKVHNLTPCTGKHCQDAKNVDINFRKKCDSAVREFLDSNKTCMLMIYAPWCGHCTNAMPKFYEASNETDTPLAVVNAEMVSPELIQGERALFNVQFFPYIVRREAVGDEVSDSIFKEAPSKAALVKHSKMSGMDHYFA